MKLKVCVCLCVRVFVHVCVCTCHCARQLHPAGGFQEEIFSFVVDSVLFMATLTDAHTRTVYTEANSEHLA